MNLPEQAVVLCGGRGERLRPLTDGIPKPMAPVLGRPFLEYLVGQLRDAGLRRIVLLNGYRGEQIEEHFGTGSAFGVEIRCVQGDVDWETGRRIAEAADVLDGRFVLAYGDNLAPFRLDALAARHQTCGLPVTLTVAAKERGNIRLGADGTVEAYDPGRGEPGLHHVEIGYMMVDRDDVLALDPGRGSFSATLRRLGQDRRLAALEPGVTYESISDLPRLHVLERFLQPRRLLLVDRDGVINRRPPIGEYVRSRADFEWVEENVAGLERLAAAGFEFVVISNQAGVGRGIMSLEDVRDVNDWMVAELGDRGIRVLDVFVCPHHWGDRCRCRKPEPGMFYDASAKHRFWLGHTLFIGDDTRDAAAARNAGCGCALVGDVTDHATAGPAAPHHRAADLDDAVPWILERFASWEAAVPAGACR
jgi:histidinol-phosphate phosphatase family protein